MNYQKDNYELAKQDREDQHKNLVLEKSDLANLNRPIIQRKNSKASHQKGDGEPNGEEGKDVDQAYSERQTDVDEEFIKEMCKFSNMSTSNNVKKCSGNTITRVNNQQLMSTKNIVEDYAIDLEGDNGIDGRPRFKEEVKLPPNYDEIDVMDPNDPILF